MVVERQAYHLGPKEKGYLFTSRQLDVLQCIVNGSEKDQEIGEELNVSQNTVKEFKQKIKYRLMEIGETASINRAIVLGIFLGHLDIKPLKPKEDLTQTENEVLLQNLQGKNHSQIAHALFISNDTLQVHNTRIQQKFSGLTMHQIVAVAAKSLKDVLFVYSPDIGDYLRSRKEKMARS